MEVFNKESAHQFEGNNMESFLLLSKLNSHSDKFTVALAEVEPKGYQYMHSHEAEQISYILEGSGIMTVGEEDREVKTGDCIFVPSNKKHGIKNSGNKILRYLSMVSPAYTLTECEEMSSQATQTH